MNRILRNKRPTYIVVDEIGYDDEDDSLKEEENCSYEFLYRPNVMKTKKEVPVVDIDELKCQKNSSDKDRTKKTRTRKVKEADARDKKSSKTDIAVSLKNEIIIDDDEEDDYVKVEDTVEASNRKRKGSTEAVPTKRVKTAQASSSKQKSKREKLKEDVNEDFDDVLEFKSSRKTERKGKNKDHTASTSTAVTEKKSKGSDRWSDVGEKRSPVTDIALLSRNEIIIDDEDDEDIKVETLVEVKRKRGRLNDVVPPKKIKTAEVSSSKWILEADEAGDLSEDDSEDSIDVVEYQPRKKTKAKRKYEDEIAVIELDKLDGSANSNETDTGASKRERKNEARSKIQTREEEESDDDVAFLPENEITIITDDEDDKVGKLEPKVPVKSTKKKELKEKALPKKKTVKASTSKKKLENKQDENSSAQEPEKTEQAQKDDCGEKLKIEWSETDYLCEFNKIDPQVAENLTALFRDDNTIPFIARYRKEMTGGMEPEQLRSIKNSYDNLKLIKQRALVIVRNIDKAGKWNPEIHAALTAAKTMNELELIYSPFKPGMKRSYAERARELGLAPVCEDILQGRLIPSLSSFVDSEREGLRTEAEVRQGIVHIIADVLSKDKTTFEALRKVRQTAVLRIQTTKSKAASKSAKTAKNEIPNNSVQYKFENYFNFVCPETSIKDYQILAINRGEAQKILSVKITAPEWLLYKLRTLCLKKYRFTKKKFPFHKEILEESFSDGYDRLINPLIVRQVRHELNERAESAAIEVFAKNLKQLLLIPPLRGKTVLGIDPGFSHGCKLAVVSHCGDVLDTATIYPHHNTEMKIKEAQRLVVHLVKKHNCIIVALGNGCACRETEMFLTDLIQDGAFAPLDLSYTIIDEAGASVYSCSEEAKSEFPDLDLNIISAISIARRLQDPLAELIKIDPKHLGIGMYQHDLPQKRLQLTLNEVISEVVSFVGVDVNTASLRLLTKVAGLNELRAVKIIEHRNNCGPFTNRQELLNVRGIGKKYFEQCAGFIRILPETTSTRGGLSPSKKFPLEYLDQTWIHPESYDVAREFLKACRCSVEELGSENFIQRVSSYVKNRSRKSLAEEFGTSETTMDIIINGLSMKKGEDIRIKGDAPLFCRNLRSIDDLRSNTTLTGLVRNATEFGAFVDIGVGITGFVPTGQMRGQLLSLGQRVEVSVLSVDKARRRIVLTPTMISKNSHNVCTSH